MIDCSIFRITNLYYLRARFYDPSTAQFLTRDPIEGVTGDAYGYAGNDPVNGSDPSGLFCFNNPFNRNDGCRSIADTNRVAHNVRTGATVVLGAALTVASVGVGVAATAGGTTSTILPSTTAAAARLAALGSSMYAGELGVSTVTLNPWSMAGMGAMLHAGAAIGTTLFTAASGFYSWRQIFFGNRPNETTPLGGGYCRADGSISDPSSLTPARQPDKMAQLNSAIVRGNLQVDHQMPGPGAYKMPTPLPTRVR